VVDEDTETMVDEGTETVVDEGTMEDMEVEEDITAAMGGMEVTMADMAETVHMMLRMVKIA
jgi:hypothetical protein